jgi:hypothetical protein
MRLPKRGAFLELLEPIGDYFPGRAASELLLWDQLVVNRAPRRGEIFSVALPVVLGWHVPKTARTVLGVFF